VTERLTVGVAARLSRYLQVLTQARKMGKERISSQEISEYTNINATQIRRDLSAFGKFGKRGVGYRTDALLEEIRQILRTQGQHNIALVGAGRLGSAIASSPIFAEHGIHVAAILDNDPDKIGERVGDLTISPIEDVADIARERNVRYVLYHWNMYNAEGRAAIRERFGAYSGHVRPLYEGQDISLFEIVSYPPRR